MSVHSPEAYEKLALTQKSQNNPKLSFTDKSEHFCPFHILFDTESAKQREETLLLIEKHFQPVYIPLFEKGAFKNIFLGNSSVTNNTETLTQTGKDSESTTKALKMLQLAHNFTSNLSASSHNEIQSIGASLAVFAENAYPNSQSKAKALTNGNKPPFHVHWLILTPDGFPIISLPPPHHLHAENFSENPTKRLSLLSEMLFYTSKAWKTNAFAMHSNAITQSLKLRDLEKDFTASIGSSSSAFRVAQHALGAIQSATGAVLHRFIRVFGKLHYSALSQILSENFAHKMELLQNTNLPATAAALADFIYFSQTFPQTIAQEKKLSHMAMQAHCALCCVAEWFVGDLYEYPNESPNFETALSTVHSLLHASRVLRFDYAKRTAALRENSGSQTTFSSSQVRDRSNEANSCSEDLVKNTEDETTVLRIDAAYAKGLYEKCVAKSEEILTKIASALQIDGKALLSDDFVNPSLEKTIYPKGVIWSNFLRCLLLFPKQSTRKAAIHFVQNVFLLNFTVCAAETQHSETPMEILKSPKNDASVSERSDASLTDYATAAGLFIDAYENTGDMRFLQYAQYTQQSIDARFYFANNSHSIYAKEIRVSASSQNSQISRSSQKYPFSPLKASKPSPPKKVIKSGTYNDVPFVSEMWFPVVRFHIDEENAVPLNLRNAIRLLHMQPDAGKASQIEKIDCTIKRSQKQLHVSPLTSIELIRPLMYYIMSFGHLSCWQTIFVHRTANSQETGNFAEIETNFDANWPAVGCRSVIAMPNGGRQEEMGQTEFLFHPFSSNSVYTNYTRYSPAVTIAHGSKVVACVDTVEKLRESMQTWIGEVNSASHK